ALSACPSSDVAAASSVASGTGAVTRSKILRPATHAAALIPRPAAIGMSLSISAKSVGTGVLARHASAANARSTALEPLTAGRANVNDARSQVQLDRDGERIEPAAKVRDRAGNENVQIQTKKPAGT